MNKCENCDTELSHEEDKLICYKHNQNYCIWCAEDNKGNCLQIKVDGLNCKVGTDNGIPF